MPGHCTAFGFWAQTPSHPGMILGLMDKMKQTLIPHCHWRVPLQLHFHDSWKGAIQHTRKTES